MNKLKTIVGDPHAKPGNEAEMLQLFAMVEELGLPTIWVGDLLDTKEVIRSKCLNLYYRYFKESKLPHTILVGNHDWHNLECKEHSLETLKELPNETIVDTPMWKDGMILIPYIHNPEMVRQVLGA